MSLQDYENEHVRIAVLRLLEKQPEYAANDSILRDALASFALNVSRDRLRGQLAWLAEQGLVTTEQLQSLVIATATERGCEAARGTITVPGVKRPSAGD